MNVKFKDEQPPQSQSGPEYDRREYDRDRGNGHGDIVKPGGPKNIFEAAERGSVGFIVKLVERTIEFNINQRDRLQRTALHWAAECGHVEVVEALIDYGCDRRLTECNGRSPIHLAARGLHVPVLKSLLEGLSEHEMELMVNQTDNYGITPVFMVLQKGADGWDCFQFLMQCGARYNTASMPKLTPEDLERLKALAENTTDHEGP